MIFGCQNYHFKDQIFWKGHKTLKQSLISDGPKMRDCFKFLWPSQKVRTLITFRGHYYQIKIKLVSMNIKSSHEIVGKTTFKKTNICYIRLNVTPFDLLNKFIRTLWTTRESQLERHSSRYHMRTVFKSWFLG